MIRPASGRISPIRCLRKTDLPPPLRPMMIVIEPFGDLEVDAAQDRLAPKDFVRPSTLDHGSTEPRK